MELFMKGGGDYGTIKEEGFRKALKKNGMELEDANSRLRRFQRRGYDGVESMVAPPCLNLDDAIERRGIQIG